MRRRRTDEDLWGALPGRLAVARARWRNQRLWAARLAEVSRQSVSFERAANLAGVGEGVLSGAAATGALATVEYRGRVLVPRWQLDRASATGVLPGVAALRRAFSGSDVALSVWVHRPHADLGHRTPLEALRAGAAAEVIDAAESATAVGW